MKIYFNNKKLSLVIVGMGGIGGNLAIYLSQMISQLPPSYDVQLTFIDGDHYEASNMVRQPCAMRDINSNKAVVMAKKCNNRFNLQIASQPKYISSSADITDLFDSESNYFPIIIGAVDNKAARQVLHDAYLKLNDVIYIDASNEDWYGEVVTGIKFNGIQLSKPKAEHYPHLLQDYEEVPEESSCEILAPTNPQFLCSNLQAMIEVVTLFTKIFVNKYIDGTFIKFDKDENEVIEMISPSLVKGW